MNKKMVKYISALLISFLVLCSTSSCLGSPITYTYDELKTDLVKAEIVNYSFTYEPEYQFNIEVVKTLSPEECDYAISAEISTNCPQTQIWYYNSDNERMDTAFCNEAIDENKWYTLTSKIHLKKGVNILKIVFANEPYTEYEYAERALPPYEDIRLAKLFITAIK